jgi:dephospho-CoA kinase
MTAVITVSEIERERRLVQQRGMSRIDIQKRLKTQMPQKEKIALADFIIDNSGTLEATQQQVEDLFNRLKSMNTIMIKRSIETYNPFTPFKRGESA